MTKHIEITCATCKDNKCEVRDTCPDDETTTERRKLVLYEVPT
jgi:hypothetical protein